MVHRIVTLVLLAILAIVHAQLWLGSYSMDHVQEMRTQIAQIKSANEVARLENNRLTSEVSDLREGKDMVEEKARSELGMVKPNEIYVQITKP
ncbi:MULTISPECIES: FtsB family cell division protein [Comamonas]|jgi:cell division protein FtsB|uniref:Cell division protein FtsB n=1 Tax=Comamonas terrigena TaxID=32013 RepID=A0A2A7UU17_COMTR|nr:MULTISPECIES: septum formation initiator family protein [Comamonas]MBP7351714.1 septum formation initiator family protein [Comamonas sp.]MBD9532565.1 septum formation initiator family protein [Comamonas sp. CMM01]MBV7418174.1 septum formation initiator family protein [Comamonas sp. CMM03]MDH0048457.1 septum formation initiator family protein [Comamonas terrigena]MDH0510865.1 septum formation initiator family protein [Comamonas terrigena]